VRVAHAIIAAMFVAAVPSILEIRTAVGQETIIVEGPGMGGAGGFEESEVRRPPWHRSVAGEACGCGPVCRPHGTFHADACGQLRAKHHHHPGVVPPPVFPRLHGWWAEGRMPTPPPLELPRCHQCGAVIAGGL
jgi:hypothetical protein